MNRLGPLLALHLAVVLFGFAGLFGKWLLLSPLVIVLGRTVVAASALAVVRRFGPGPSPLDWRLFANGATLALHWVAFFAAIQVSSVAVGLLGFASFPLFVLALERIVLKRRWRRDEAATAALVTLGLVLLVPDFSLADRVVQGLLWGLLSGFTFALLAVANRRLAAQRSAADLAFWQNAVAALVLAPAVVVTGAWTGLGAREVALLLVLGLACTALAHTLFIGALRRVTAHTASVIAGLEPVYGIALAALLLGEIPDLHTVAGGALIVGAALLATRAHRATAS